MTPQTLTAQTMTPPFRKALRLASTILFMALSVFLVAFGILYASVTDLLFFHAAAVPKQALNDVKPLYFALMTLIGGASGALGLLGAFVTLGPARQGSTAAATAVAVTYCIAFIMAAVTAEKLAAATHAPTSWHIMGVLLAITATAWVLHALAARSAGARRLTGDVKSGRTA